MKLALAGIGKIARDQHVPALSDSGDWTLDATISRAGTVDGVEAHKDFGAFLAARPDIPAVSLCMPPQPRFAYAAAALRAGRHVMLEKPPGQTLAEVHALETLARENGVTLFATWHSRMAQAVAAAKAALADETVTGGQITWAEDVRHWHPGQDWVFDPGGMGVFDPGINALSILTEILPAPVHLTGATLETPANRQTPIGADLRFTRGITARFDWRQEGPQTWDIRIQTQSGGVLLLRNGGSEGTWNDAPLAMDTLGEYPALYARFAALVGAGQSDVDLTPFVHVCDALALGERRTSDPFDW